MEMVLHSLEDFNKNKLDNQPNKHIIAETIEALMLEMKKPGEVLRVVIEENQRTYIYSPYAVCIIDSENVILLDRSELKKLYFNFYKV